MLIRTKNPADRDIWDLYTPGRSTCFHCNKVISAPTPIHWHGSDDHGKPASLLFHPGCAVELSIRLLRDVHAIECQEHLEVHLRPEPRAPRS